MYVGPHVTCVSALECVGAWIQPWIYFLSIALDVVVTGRVVSSTGCHPINPQSKYYCHHYIVYVYHVVSKEIKVQAKKTNESKKAKQMKNKCQI